MFAKTVQAQDNRKIAGFLELADAYWAQEQYAEALLYYNEVCQLNPDHTYATYQLAECSRHLFRYRSAESAYGKVVYAGANMFPKALFYYALTEKLNGKYSQAIHNFDTFIAFASQETVDKLESKQEWIDRAVLEKEGCVQALAQESKPYREFNFTRLTEPVASPSNEYAPVLYKNDSSLVITSAREGSTGKQRDTRFGESFSDFYKFEKDAQTWQKVSQDDNFGLINTKWNEGAGMFNRTKDKFYFTSCSEGDDACKIYVSTCKDGKWGTPVKLNKNINLSGFNSRHPALSFGGDTLFFVSNRPGGYGNNDIWMSLSAGNDSWGPPTNLGKSINTPLNELSPFFDPIEGILFFASDGHQGFGGIDLYMAKGTTFDEVKIRNVGSPFNSNRDDCFFVLGEKKGYLASNRFGGEGSFDIFSFNIFSNETVLAGVTTRNQKDRPDLSYFDWFNLDYLAEESKLTADRIISRREAGKIYNEDLPMSQEELFFYEKLSSEEKKQLERIVTSRISKLTNEDVAALQEADAFYYEKLSPEEKARINRFAEAYRQQKTLTDTTSLPQEDQFYYEKLSYQEKQKLDRLIAWQMHQVALTDSSTWVVDSQEQFLYEKLPSEEKSRIDRMASARMAARKTGTAEQIAEEDRFFYDQLSDEEKEKLDRLIDARTHVLANLADASHMDEEYAFAFAKLPPEEKSRIERMAKARQAARISGGEVEYTEEDQFFYTHLSHLEKERLDKMIQAKVNGKAPVEDPSALAEGPEFIYQQLPSHEKNRIDRMVAARQVARRDGADVSDSPEDAFFYSHLSELEKEKLDRVINARLHFTASGTDLSVLPTETEFAFEKLPTAFSHRIDGKNKARKRGEKITVEDVLLSESEDSLVVSASRNFQMGNYASLSISGRLRDVKTGLPVAKITIPLVDEKGVPIKSTTSGEDGRFRYVGLPVIENYRLILETPPTRLTETMPYIVEDLVVEGFSHPITPYHFENITFDFGKSTLKPEAKAVLDRLAVFVKEHPEVQVEINAFTDNIGSDAFNIALSKQRGKEVFHYLVNKDIAAPALVVNARGESNPLQSNQLKEGREVNRRVEFIIHGSSMLYDEKNETVIIQAGTSLAEIAQLYGMTVEEVKKMNGFTTDTIEPYRPVKVKRKRPQ